jgi:hypothetical protein
MGESAGATAPDHDAGRVKLPLPDGGIEGRFECSLCGATAGTIRLVPRYRERPWAERTSFTSFMQCSLATDAVGKLELALATGDARAAYEVDHELAPFYCPACARSYCGDHWQRWDEFDDGFYDCTRGRCPEGHERKLED